MIRTLPIALLLAALAGAAQAQATPSGLWKTIDDDGRTEKSLIRISETGGVYSGRIEKGLEPNPAETVCSKCTDERKNQPIIGMTVIRNIRASDDPEIYDGGDVLDPNKGKIYRLRLRLLEGGKKLEVRGYIGPFYRNQQWIRVE